MSCYLKITIPNRRTKLSYAHTTFNLQCVGRGFCCFCCCCCRTQKFFIKMLKYSIILKDKIDISMSVYLVISDMETETIDKGGKWNNEYSISFSGVHKSQIYGNMLELVYTKSFDIYFFHKNLYDYKSSYRIYIKPCEFRCQLYISMHAFQRE